MRKEIYIYLSVLLLVIQSGLLAHSGLAFASGDNERPNCGSFWVSIPESSKREDAMRCIDSWLEIAYEGNDEPNLDYDPRYGSEIEIEYSTAEFRGMASNIESYCTTLADYEGRCSRVVEFLQQVAKRRMSMFEGTDVMESIQGPLETILEGRTLTYGDLFMSPITSENCNAFRVEWSPLVLWKFENAVRARHGVRFEDPDLNAFFYGVGGRPEEESGPLPVIASTNGPVELTAVDRSNLALIARAQDRFNQCQVNANRPPLGARLTEVPGDRPSCIVMTSFSYANPIDETERIENCELRATRGEFYFSHGDHTWDVDAVEIGRSCPKETGVEMEAKLGGCFAGFNHWHRREVVCTFFVTLGDCATELDAGKSKR